MPKNEEELLLNAEESDDELEQDHALDAAESRRYRAVTARLNYLAADRVDIQYAVKEAARGMSSPKKSGWSILNPEQDWQVPQG